MTVTVSISVDTTDDTVTVDTVLREVDAAAYVVTMVEATVEEIVEIDVVAVTVIARPVAVTVALGIG